MPTYPPVLFPPLFPWARAPRDPMPRKVELTWDKNRRRWKKYFRGRQYYFPFGKHKLDREGYETALDAWRKKRAEIEGADPPAEHLRDYEFAISRRQQLADWYNSNGEPKAALRLQNEIKELRTSDHNLPLSTWEIDPLRHISEAGKAVWQDRLSSFRKKTGLTLTKTIDQFISSQKRACDAKQIGQATYSLISYKVLPFKNFAGAVLVKDVDAKTLAGFHAHLLDQISEKTYSTTYANSLMKTAKRIIKWAYIEGLIAEMPRSMLQRGAYAITIDEPEIKTLSIQTIHEILNLLSPRFQLYVLLMMNCGFTQQDVADLTWEQVDLTAGTIYRKRTKTQKNKRTPKICFQLWRRTHRLLKTYNSSTDSEWVLLNNNGRQLVRKYLGTNGKLTEIDNIKKTFARIMAANKISATLKNFRATSSTMLDENLKYGRYAQYFLGHAPRNVADNHYVQPSQDNFDRAIMWLGQQYEIVPKSGERKLTKKVVNKPKQP